MSRQVYDCWRTVTYRPTIPRDPSGGNGTDIWSWSGEAEYKWIIENLSLTSCSAQNESCVERLSYPDQSLRVSLHKTRTSLSLLTLNKKKTIANHSLLKSSESQHAGKLSHTHTHTLPRIRATWIRLSPPYDIERKRDTSEHSDTRKHPIPCLSGSGRKEIHAACLDEPQSSREKMWASLLTHEDSRRARLTVVARKIRPAQRPSFLDDRRSSGVKRSEQIRISGRETRAFSHH